MSNVVFNLEVISPEGNKYQGKAVSLTANTKNGQLTILANHTPLFTVLDPGELVVHKEDGEDYFSVGSGFLEVSRKKVKVLVDKALHADEIDEQKILEAQEKAKKILEEKPKGEIFIRNQAAFRRSLIDLKIAKKRKKRHRL